MVDQRLKELRGPGRREFLRWSATVAACLGLERARFLNVLGDTAGTAAADTAACANTNRLISIVDGNGGLSNWTQIFPIQKVIASTNAAYSHYALGKGIAATGYDKPGYMYAPGLAVADELQVEDLRVRRRQQRDAHGGSGRARSASARTACSPRRLPSSRPIPRCFRSSRSAASSSARRRALRRSRRSAQRTSSSISSTARPLARCSSSPPTADSPRRTTRRSSDSTRPRAGRRSPSSTASARSR